MMKNIKWLLILILIPAAGVSQEINWMEYGQGLQQARAQNKKVFLQFKTTWCSACVFMEKNTFSNERVVEYLNAHFISIAVDGDRQPDLRRKYRVTGYPSNFFLDHSGKVVYSRPGALEPSVFHFFLEYVKSESYKTMRPMEYYKNRQL